MRSRFGERFATWLSVPARRPWTTLGVAAVCTALGIVGAARITPEVSIQSMLSEDNAAARALAAIAADFSTTDELVVLAEVPAGVDLSRGEKRTRLVAFAQRLSDQLTQSASPDLQVAVTHQAMPQLREFVRKEVVPAGFYYLDDDQFAELDVRLSSQGIREQIVRNEELLATPGPAGSGQAKRIAKDPLRLHEFLAAPVAPASSGLASADDDLLLSTSGDAILIRITGSQPVSDLDYAQRLTERVREAVGGINDEGLGISYTGAYAIATTAQSRIRADMIRSITLSVILLCLLFLFVYRNFAAFPLAAVPVAAGIVVAFGLSSFGSAHLTPIVAVIGALLAGLAIDFSIHFLSHYKQQRGAGKAHAPALASTLSTVGPVMAAACVTSVVGFLAISQSSVRGLREFAVIGALGLAFALIAAVTVLPALLTVTSSRVRKTVSPRLLAGLIEPVVRGVIGRSRIVVTLSFIAGFVGLGIAVSSGGIVQFETDMSVMHPKPNPAIEAQARIGEQFGLPEDPLLVHLAAETPEELVSLAHRLKASLSGAGRSGAEGPSTFGLASLIPDPALHLARPISLGAEQVIADFDAAVADSIFVPAAYDEYRSFLRKLLAATPEAIPTLESVLRYPQLARSLLPRDAGTTPRARQQAITLIYPGTTMSDRDSRALTIENIRYAISDVPGATLTGLPVLGHDTETMIRSDLTKLLPLTGGIVLIWLTLFFRRVGDTLLALLPTLFGLSCLVGILTLIGFRLNTINLVGLPLLIGIGVDDGIFLVGLARAGGRSAAELTERLATGCHAVLMTTATTLLTFGTLVFTSTPAIRSLGLLLGIGMVACLVGTLFLLVPILATRRPTATRNGR